MTLQLNTIYNEDCLETMKRMPDGFVDLVLTDPPYGYSFMGKSWDKAVPSVEIWRECLRVLKPGGWCMVMSAPRSDVQNAMISRLMEAGFRLDFTPIYWTYASGFPKAGNVGKLVDKRLGAERDVVGYGKEGFKSITKERVKQGYRQNLTVANERTEVPITKAASPEAKALDGSYTGFQPKPAVEVVIVAMKPLSEKTYVDQALKNGKGITWLDDCRVPAEPELARNWTERKAAAGFGNSVNTYDPDNDNTRIDDFSYYKAQGRFPANLLVSDQALNGHSKYFDLDAWADTLPFLAVPKASKSEKNKGLEGFEVKQSTGGGGGIGDYKNDVNSASGKYGSEKAPAKNHHPTVKPIRLMSYLITLTTREGDTVLDPFVGSGTTVVAAKQLGRKGIGIEREPEYAEIAQARVDAAEERLRQGVLL